MRLHASGKVSAAALILSLLVPPAVATEQAASAEQTAAVERLVDTTRTSGIDFVHFNGMTGRLYFAETVGAGGALFDYDGDGDLDVFLVQGHLLGEDRSLSDALRPWPSSVPLRDRLFRNDLHRDASGAPVLEFKDVTEESLIRSTGYGIGATVGDIDNDGDVDLYVLNFGQNALWRNRGDGTFEEASELLGDPSAAFSVSGTFSDADGDQRLDLYVANYVNFSFATHKQCLTDRGENDYCGPSAFAPQADRLFLNTSNGTFIDRSSLLVKAAAGMGVISADFDGNGLADFYVANDLHPNQLLFATKEDSAGLQYRDDALLFGLALNHQGEAEASMSLDAADVDADGDLDLFATHFRRESNTLYLRDESGFYADRTAAFGLAQPSWPMTSFGGRFIDLDLDGDLDLVVANGAVTFRPGDDRSLNPYGLDEPNQFFRNDGGRFIDASSEVPALDGQAAGVSRAVLNGDLDNDGDVDLIITNNSGPAVVLRNDFPRPAGTSWLGLDLRLDASLGSRTANGAMVTFESAESVQGQPRVVRVHTDGGYAAAADHRILRAVVVSEGSTSQTLVISVAWPDGRKERFRLSLDSAAIARYHRIVQGAGKSVSAD